MFDFRLKVFYTAAKQQSFSRAAEELFISQPAVSKHISALESYFNVNLFLRHGSKISLTADGQVLFQYAKEIFSLYRKLQFSMDKRAKRKSGHLRLGSSTTLTQYVLPKFLYQFHEEYPEITLEVINGNSHRIEIALLNKEIDLGIIEGRTQKRDFKYTPFLKDELVLVTRSDHTIAQKGTISVEELKDVPMVIREFGSGTLQVLHHYLKNLGLSLKDLNIELILGNTEGIKTYLRNTRCFAFLSLNSVLEELQREEFTVIELPGPSLSRFFYFINPQGDNDPLAEMFMQFVMKMLPRF